MEVMAQLRKWASLLCGAVWLVPLGAGAQTAPEQSKFLPFELDYAQFRALKDYVYLELYLSLFRNQLQFIQDSERGNYRADFTAAVEIFKGDSLVAEDQWTSVNFADSLGEVLPSHKLFTLTAFTLFKGEYVARVKVTDIHSGKAGEAKFNLPIIPFSEEKLTVSDIELAMAVSPDTSSSRYVKNNYQVIPNPGGLFGSGLPMLYFYSEIYNLAGNGTGAGDSEYTVTYLVLNGDGQVVKSFPAKVKKKPGRSAVEVGGFNVITLPSGTYFLKIDVQDKANQQRASSQKKFFVFREGDFAMGEPPTSTPQKVDIASLTSSEYYKQLDQAKEDDLNEEFESTRYISTDEERRIFKTLDLQGKREFLKAFWAKRDNNPQTPRNEFRDEYVARVKYANDNFSGFKKGWKTDRGRVLLVYGRPDEIERFPAQGDAKDYQIWRYFSLQGGVEFVFVDRRGWGDLELVHSSARGEINDADWERWIRPGR